MTRPRSASPLTSSSGTSAHAAVREAAGRPEHRRGHHAYRTLTADLQVLLDRAAGRAITIGQLMNTLRGRGMALVVILLASPFVVPVPLPLLSIPLGAMIAVLGLRLGLGLTPWLPRRLRRWRLEHTTLVRVVHVTRWMARPLETFLRPRFSSLFARGVGLSAGLCIVLAAATMMLPIPVPASNSLPAIAIVLLAGGIMERDAVFVLAGHATTFAALAYLYFWWDLVAGLLSGVVS